MSILIVLGGGAPPADDPSARLNVIDDSWQPDDQFGHEVHVSQPFVADLVWPYRHPARDSLLRR